MADLKPGGQVSEAKKYPIACLNDFMAIPTDRLVVCLNELMPIIMAARAAKELQDAVTPGGVFEFRKVVWTDDGKEDLNIHLNKVERPKTSPTPSA